MNPSTKTALENSALLLKEMRTNLKSIKSGQDFCVEINLETNHYIQIGQNISELQKQIIHQQEVIEKYFTLYVEMITEKIDK